MMEQRQKFVVALLVVVVLAVVAYYGFNAMRKANAQTNNTGTTNNAGGNVTTNTHDYASGGNTLITDTPVGDTSKVNLIITAINTNDNQPRQWAIFRANPNGNWGAEKVASTTLQPGLTWEFKNFPSGTYWFAVQQNGGSGFGQYFAIITVVGGVAVNQSGLDASNAVKFTV